MEYEKEYDSEDMNPSQDQQPKEENNPGDDFVMHTRRGVQRLHKKRGTGTIATQQRHSSSTSQPASQPSQTTSQRGRGRGRNT